MIAEINVMVISQSLIELLEVIIFKGRVWKMKQIHIHLDTATVAAQNSHPARF